MVGVKLGRIKGLEPGCQNSGPHLDGDLFFLLFKIDRPGGTKFFTGLAFSLLEVDAVFLINGILQGYCLGITYIGCLALDESLVVFIVHFFGTLLRACVTGNAFVHVDVARMPGDLHVEIAWFPGDGSDFGKGQKLNVEMPADLDQFGRDNSHGAIIGREGLVQLGHDPTNGR